MLENQKSNIKVRLKKDLLFTIDEYDRDFVYNYTAGEYVYVQDIYEELGNCSIITDNGQYYVISMDYLDLDDVIEFKWMTPPAIQSRITQNAQEITKLMEIQKTLLEELCIARQIEFERKLGIKSGDIITDRAGEEWKYDALTVDSGTIKVLVHQFKAGKVSSLYTFLLPCDFIEGGYR